MIQGFACFAGTCCRTCATRESTALSVHIGSRCDPIRKESAATDRALFSPDSLTQHPSLRMKKPSVPLGLVFSRSGPYEMMAGEMLKSASMAIDEVNQCDAFDFVFAPHLRDPGGVVAAYHTACADLIREEHVDH